jgi:hypothetical protein|tara:strand:- start:460 stop:600 length:141 start_codon:yes stop_codon:yes gene_type:complete
MFTLQNLAIVTTGIVLSYIVTRLIFTAYFKSRDEYWKEREDYEKKE